VPELILAAILTAALVASPAVAGETLLGDNRLYAEAVEAIQTAVAEDDGETLALYIPYGEPININGEERVFESEQDFHAAYDEIMTPEIKAAVVEQRYEDMFVNSEGVMFGNGQMWISGICRDDACAQFDVRIITIQSTAAN